MSPRGVVVAVDVLKESGPGIVDVFELPVSDQFALDGPDDGLAPGIVIGIGFRRRALVDLFGIKKRTEEAAAVLVAPVAVEDSSLKFAGRASRALLSASTTRSERMFSATDHPTSLECRGR